MKKLFVFLLATIIGLSSCNNFSKSPQDKAEAAIKKFTKQNLKELANSNASDYEPISFGELKRLKETDNPRMVYSLEHHFSVKNPNGWTEQEEFIFYLDNNYEVVDK